jgi:chromate transporter
LTALAGVVLPSFLIILAVAIFFTQIRHNQIVDAAFKGIRPIVVALMFAPALGFARSISGVATAVAAAVALMIWYAGITPILLLLAGAIIGLLLAARRGKEVKR